MYINGMTLVHLSMLNHVGFHQHPSNITLDTLGLPRCGAIPKLDPPSPGLPTGAWPARREV